jgi:hypothetical protein
MLRNGKPPSTFCWGWFGTSDGEGNADAADNAAAAPVAAHPAPDAEAPQPPLADEADNAPYALDDDMAAHARIIYEQAAAELDDRVNEPQVLRLPHPTHTSSAVRIQAYRERLDLPVAEGCKLTLKELLWHVVLSL